MTFVELVPHPYPHETKPSTWPIIKASLANKFLGTNLWSNSYYCTYDTIKLESALTDKIIISIISTYIPRRL